VLKISFLVISHPYVYSSHGHTDVNAWICKVGIPTMTVRPENFKECTKGIQAEIRIEVVDQSSVFYEIIP